MDWMLIGAGVLLAVIVLLRIVTTRRVVSVPHGPPADPGKIEALLRSGRKIQAIKELRAQTRLGLKEAKEEVEAIARRLGIE